MCSDSLVILGKYVYNDMSGNLTKSDRKANSCFESVRVTLSLTEACSELLYHTGLEALPSKKKVSIDGTGVPGFLRPVW